GEEATPWLDAAASSCPVLGWAEDSLDWQKLNDAALIRFLKVRTSPNEVQIVRHETGFVILKRPSGTGKLSTGGRLFVLFRITASTRKFGR
ncbi:MAG: hypothetical protein WB610_17425, partial [Rhodomicrobium sp.]